MIAIERREEPDILKKNKSRWLEVFLDKGLQRPPSSQYAHKDIKDALSAISFKKCFFCESKVGVGEDEKPEIDHYIGLAENRKLAFAWTNLYLSCFSCNRGKIKSKIPVSDCLDPCNPGVDPADHLTFEKEYIRPKNRSRKGLKTIQKYKLDRDGLDHRRVKQLHDFERRLRQIGERQIRDGGRELTTDEKERISYFKSPENAFSLMFSIYFKTNDL